MTSVRLEITAVPCLQDNYCYLIAARESGEAWLVDPSEPDAPGEALQKSGLRLRGILATHHHWDHTGGIEGLLALVSNDGVWVAGHASDRGRIPGQTVFVEAPQGRYVSSGLEVGGVDLQAMHIPGHTLGAIAWCLPVRDGEPADVFTGDTLFAAGCGRLFEGSPAQMLASLQALTAGPPDTRLWFGHEYTAANLRFAAATEPDNEAVTKRLQVLDGSSTTPTTVALEQATNPFVRAKSVDEMARRRAAKDAF